MSGICARLSALLLAAMIAGAAAPGPTPSVPDRLPIVFQGFGLSPDGLQAVVIARRIGSGSPALLAIVDVTQSSVRVVARSVVAGFAHPLFIDEHHVVCLRSEHDRRAILIVDTRDLSTTRIAIPLADASNLSAATARHPRGWRFVLATRIEGRSRIWAMDWRGAWEQVSLTAEDAALPCLSDDGVAIAYVVREGRWQRSLVVINRVNGARDTVLSRQASLVPIGFTAEEEGRRLVFVGPYPPAGGDGTPQVLSASGEHYESIQAVSLAQFGQRPNGRSGVRGAALGADGTVAFSSEATNLVEGPSEPDGIYLSDGDTVRSVPLFGHGTMRDPVLSADGRRIGCMSRRRDAIVVVDPRVEANRCIITVTPDGELRVDGGIPAAQESRTEGGAP